LKFGSKRIIKIRGFNIGVVVKIHMDSIRSSPGRKIRFGSSTYLNKEFWRKFKKKMFVNLFYIYFRLSHYKTLQSSIKELFSKDKQEIQVIENIQFFTDEVKKTS